VPKSILEKAPSADLWTGQTDEAEMGINYRDVDVLLYHMIDQRESTEELVKRGYDSEYIKRIQKMVMRTQFKRLPPVIAKVSNRTINTDFRYPRDWGS
jgi:NAD+ synthase